MDFNRTAGAPLSSGRTVKAAVTLLDTVAEQLADVDITLPDYCPDIEKILKCTLSPQIRSKSFSAGQLQVEGSCIVSVLYVENIKKSVRCCEQSVEFSQSFAVKDSSSADPVAIVRTKSEYINCRALSPRRLVIHGAFSLYAKVLTTSEIKLYSPDETMNIEVNRITEKCASLRALCQEQFSLSEAVTVGEKPAIESILYSDVKMNIVETKAVTDKLMVNGEISFKILYLSDVESGETEKLDYIIPFNQIMDCEGIDENTLNNVSCDIMSYDIRLKNDMTSEKPALLLDIRFTLTEEGRVTEDEDIITDAYSVDYFAQPKLGRMTLISDASCISESHIEKCAVRTDSGKISKVINIYAENVSANGSFNDSSPVVEGKISLCILALNEENVPIFIERNAEYSHPVPSGADYNSISSATARTASISYRLSDDNTIEVRCELKILLNVEKKISLNAVEAVEVFEDKPIEKDNFALTLYFAKEGESLWSIAKSYNTRLDMLIRENSADKPVLEHSQMLLIPRI